MRNDLLPFSAVVGQEEAKLALILTACDRRVGGVLLRGEKGSAKSTLARGLASLLPGDAPFVDLPIGATEDRVVGTLDLAAALTGGQKRFDPGLLAAANGGVLYVDEINLLPDHLVDVLLDVAASGVNLVEREGVSHSHPSQFLLIGSMNPEEGDLRPQLLDRFGLAVEMRGSSDPAVRSAAVRRRLEFDADPEGVVARYAQTDAELALRLAASVPASLPDDLIDAVSGICAEVGAEGLRADLTICRAAAALAGWEGRAVAGAADVRRVAHLALSHRARRDPLDPSGLDTERFDEVVDRHLGPDDPGGSENACGGEPAGGTPGGGSVDSGEQGDSSGGDPGGADGGGDPGGADGGDDPRGADGGDDPRGADGGDDPRGIPDLEGRPPHPAPPGLVAAAPGRRHEATSARGRTVGDTAPDRPMGPVAVGPTVRRAAARMAGMEPAQRTGSGPLVEASDIRQAVREQRTASLVVLTVDASGSMGATRRMEAARSAVLAMLRDAYQRRDLVAMVAFRSDRAEVVLKPTGSVEVARARLAEMSTGGRTPLAEGLLRGLQTALTPSRAASHEPLLVVVTDGRATSDPRGGNPLDAAMAAAREVARAGVPSVVVDVEAAGGGSGLTRLGLARNLALAMGARDVQAGEVTAEVIKAAAAQAVGASSRAATSSQPRGEGPSDAMRPASTETSHGAPGTS